MKFIGIIPARYASSRFPGKPLAMLGGETVIERVYKQVSSILTDVYVATDDERISKYGPVIWRLRAVMTRSDHKSGTDRICEALDKIGIFYDVVINIQGDEPFIQKSQIKTVMNCFDDPQTQIATLGKHFKSMESAKIQILQKLFWIIILMLFISPALLYLLCEGMRNPNGLNDILF